jgi:primosomal protein N''
VVKLLLARMESHPEEFGHGVSRWGWMIENVLENCSKEEAEAIKEGLRPIRLQEIHETVMDELLNGTERRRIEEQEYERSLMNRAQPMLLKQQQAMQSGSYGKPLVSARHPTSSDMEQNGIMNALRNII